MSSPESLSLLYQGQAEWKLERADPRKREKLIEVANIIGKNEIERVLRFPLCQKDTKAQLLFYFLL